jgi:hypothetical protein
MSTEDKTIVMPANCAFTRAAVIDHLITITCGGMTKVCKTPEDWDLREKNMREFAELLLADGMPPA